MDIYKLLANTIQSKINKAKLYGSDCNLLSQRIYDETHKQVSISTLKRFFGLIKGNHKPSKYTLDTLSEFVGFDDWNDFRSCYDDLKLTDTDEHPWELLKRRMMQVTHNSLESLKQRTNYKKEEFIFRQAERDRFERFVASNVPATLFIAPGGYGKSTLMIQLVEKYFLHENGKFKNDIVCLIDGGIFFNLYSKNSNIDLLNQLLRFEIDANHHFYFQKHPEKRKGRIWLIIDDVDDVFVERARYYQFIDNIMHIMMIDEGGWLKVLLTCRPENLDVFEQILHKNPVRRSFWFDVGFSFEKYLDPVNISLFSTDEIKSVLKLHHAESNYKDIFSRYKDVLEIISHPNSFSLFINEFKQNENISEIILLNRFIKTRILSPPFIEKKMLLLKRFISLCKRGIETNLVEKNQLLSEPELVPAYDQLISDGIFYEYFIPTDTIDLKIMISFTQKTILEYFIFRSWIQDKAYSSDLLFEIIEYYKNNKVMQCSMIKFFVKMMVHNKEIGLIKQINDKLAEYEAFSKTDNISECLTVLVATLKGLLDNNKELQNYSGRTGKQYND